MKKRAFLRDPMDRPESACREVGRDFVRSGMMPVVALVLVVLGAAAGCDDRRRLCRDDTDCGGAGVSFDGSGEYLDSSTHRGIGFDLFSDPREEITLEEPDIH